ncbi:hypothetical protein METBISCDRAFT_12759 [Metschnikowia bicuspidata]|uniref:Protein STU1 n=1 Tax=Metschnikowia bicuspidata TaxID=27322 RepID=A0A4P9ZJ72_9ASCO|nr:hypothetical protein METBISCDRAFT_12759 [Metschnikowia bicuspidata]
MSLPGDAFHRAILSGTNETRRSTLVQFKTHVKKDNVDLPSVPKYFDALAVSTNLLDPDIIMLAFSLVCHLVKRISIQDKSGTILPSVAPVVFPIVIPRIADPRTIIKVSARRALEAYWLSAPDHTQRAVAEIGLGSAAAGSASDGALLLANESVVWLNSLLLINANLDLHLFFRPLAHVLVRRSGDARLMSNVKILFANYFDLKHNRLQRYELQKALESSGVPAALRTAIVGTESALTREYDTRAALSRPAPPAPTRSISGPTAASLSALPAPASFKERRTAGPESRKPFQRERERQTETAAAPGVTATDDQELQALLATVLGMALEEGVQLQYVASADELSQIIASAGPCFEGKETERNWVLREKVVSKLRALTRGNAPLQFAHAFAVFFKDMAEPICKALMSLRTSLCLSACQLVKELAAHLQYAFAPLVDVFWSTLLRLCANTKQLTSKSAHATVCTILACTTPTAKMAHKMCVAAKEKSASVRVYAAMWLQVFIVRSHALWPVPPSCDLVEEALVRLLPDSNVQVRLAAKDAFWRYYVVAVDAATALLARVDPKIVKALERSRPHDCGPPGPLVTLPRLRPSLREAIVARSRDERRSVSRSSSRNERRPGAGSLEVAKHDFDAVNGSDTNSVTDTLNSAGARHGEPNGFDKSISDLHTTAEASKRSVCGPVVNALHNLFPPDLQPADKSATAPFSVISSIRPGSAPEMAPPEKDPETVAGLLSAKAVHQNETGLRMLLDMLADGILVPARLHTLACTVSVAHPHLFKPHLLDQNTASHVASVLGAEDLVRTCLVALGDATMCRIVLTQQLGVPALVSATAALLAQVCNMDAISDRRMLVMQLIKFKATVLDTLMQVMAATVPAMPAGAPVLAALLRTLLGLVPIVYQTHIVSLYLTVLQALHAQGAAAFEAQLEQSAPQNQREVRCLLGMASEPRSMHGAVQDVPEPTLNALEFTLIAPGADKTAFSPLKHPSDFTMLFPSKLALAADSNAAVVSVAENTVYTASDVVSVAVPCSAGTDAPPAVSDGYPELTNAPPVAFGSNRSNGGTGRHTSGADDVTAGDKSFQNIFAKSNTKALHSDFVTRLNSDPARDLDPARHLVDDFAQVKLTGLSNTIESFIEKVDPFRGLASRSKPITIFEDPKGGSPQRVRDYSYTALNWFNFLIARLAAHEPPADGRDSVQSLCKDMQSGVLSPAQLSVVLRTLQRSRGTTLSAEDAGDALDACQYAQIEAALFDYLSLRASNKLLALMLLKQLLVCHHALDLLRLWGALVDISADAGVGADQDFVMELALREVFDEMLCGLYSSADLFSAVLGTLQGGADGSLSGAALLFVLEALYPLLESKALVLLISDDLITDIDRVLRPHMQHDSARVRTVVFKTYGLFARASAELSAGSACAHEGMAGIISEFSDPEQKLVGYYSRDGFH